LFCCYNHGKRNFITVGERAMTYVYLALAIVTEVIGTSLLKSTEEFTKVVPSVIVVVCYLLSFWLLTLTLREMAVGVVYAIWSGLGIVLVAAVAAIYYKQVPDLAAIVGMALIIIGVLVIHLFSSSIQH
jgi:small multidrug resistance pump